ncbi:hypothetical protein SH528x_000927 [Novipirellula sp. SH528]|uniref:hypothetical protein n=1 Tax=Novipirellula sp. SH528 TaxID=3454466 RepID=UPI003FA10AE8
MNETKTSEETNPEIEADLNELAKICCRSLAGESDAGMDRAENLLKSLLMSGYAGKKNRSFQVDFEKPSQRTVPRLCDASRRCPVVDVGETGQEICGSCSLGIENSERRFATESGQHQLGNRRLRIAPGRHVRILPGPPYSLRR